MTYLGFLNLIYQKAIAAARSHIYRKELGMSDHNPGPPYTPDNTIVLFVSGNGDMLAYTNRRVLRNVVLVVNRDPQDNWGTTPIRHIVPQQNLLVLTPDPSEEAMFLYKHHVEDNLAGFAGPRKLFTHLNISEGSPIEGLNGETPFLNPAFIRRFP